MTEPEPQSIKRGLDRCMLTYHQFMDASKSPTSRSTSGSQEMSSNKKYTLETSSTTVYNFYTKTNKVSVVSGTKVEELDSMDSRTIILKLINLAAARERFREERSVGKPILCTAFMVKFGERLRRSRQAHLDSLLRSIHVRKELKDVVADLLRDVIQGKIRAMFPQDQAQAEREDTTELEASSIQVVKAPLTPKIEFETCPSTEVDDPVEDIKTLRKRKRAAERDRLELEQSYRNLGRQIRDQLEQDVDCIENDVKALKTKIQMLFEDNDDSR